MPGRQRDDQFVNDTLLRTVLSCPVDHLVGNCTTERGAGNCVAAIVNTGPDARLVGFLSERPKRGGIAREQVPEDGGRRGRKAAVRGWIAWMVRCWEQWFHLCVELEGANGPVCIFAIPAGDSAIKRGDVLERVGARRQRRITVEPVLKDEAADLPAPIVVSAQAASGILPEIGGSVRFGRALEGLQLSKLGGFLGRIVRNGRRRPELARRGQHPGLPCRH